MRVWVAHENGPMRRVSPRR